VPSALVRILLKHQPMLHADNARLVRMALFTSLGLIPLGCAGRSLDAPIDAENQSAGAGGQSSHPTSPHPNTNVGGASSTLASCGESTVVYAEERSHSISGRPRTLVLGIESGTYRCEDGLLHRPAQITCPSNLPRPLPADSAADAGANSGASSNPTLSQFEFLYGQAPSPSSWGGEPCTADAECTGKPHGYCAPSYGVGPVPSTNQCHYGCLTDTDCGTGYLCECGDPVGHCLPATCQTDADCPGELLCAAWSSANICGTVGESFSCQTAEDECNSAADCPSDQYGSYCSGEGRVRTCEVNGSVCGRPFLVAGEARLAPRVPGTDWCERGLIDRRLTAEGSALSAPERQLVADRWSELGLMEHASIAAFARFTLQLLHVGAPRDLVERSQQAMLDETLHTQLCFELASRYLERPVGPGRLLMDSALQETELTQIVVTTFREGCVGETVATLEARAALDGATDPFVKRTLARIAEDELRHAELAWRFVRWALTQQSPTLRAALATEVRRLERELEQSPEPAAGTTAITDHGILSGRDQRQIRRTALAEVVLPCAASLLALSAAAQSRASGCTSSRPSTSASPSRTSGDAE
jgi:hypothetical protein